MDRELGRLRDDDELPKELLLPEEAPNELLLPDAPPNPLGLLPDALGALPVLFPPHGLVLDFALPLELPHALPDDAFGEVEAPDDAAELAPKPVAAFFVFDASRDSKALAAPLFDEKSFPEADFAALPNLDGVRVADADLKPADGADRLTGLTCIEVRYCVRRDCSADEG